jgi:acyl-CoA synthetase (AMP-forming)/AMP-acid ligase II
MPRPAARDDSDVTITEYVRHARQAGHRRAHQAHPRHRQLADGARRAAAGLAKRGFGKGDVLAIYCPNLPEYAIVFLGVAMAGGINTTVNPLYTADELANQLRDSGARFLVTAPPFLDKAKEGAAKSGVEEIFILGAADGVRPFTDLMQAGDQPPALTMKPAEDLVALPYSSGTTGLPKGVMLTHRNLVANLCQAEGMRNFGASASGTSRWRYCHSSTSTAWSTTIPGRRRYHPGHAGFDMMEPHQAVATRDDPAAVPPIVLGLVVRRWPSSTPRACA